METTVRRITLKRKNIKYFAAELSGVRRCKLIINEFSEQLLLGVEYSLPLEDLSVKTNFGTTIIYLLPAPASAQACGDQVRLKVSSINQWCLDECHRLGGWWDFKTEAWLFAGFLAEEVAKLEQRFGNLVKVEVDFPTGMQALREPIMVMGYDIATASSPDSGASFNEAHFVLRGQAFSGGVGDCWTTNVSPGTRLRMFMAKQLYDEFLWDGGLAHYGYRVQLLP